MTQIYFPELWISEWEMNILVVWDQLSHRMFYFPYPQPVLILNVCQSYFLSWKINENNIISHAEIKMYAYFISTNTFCFLPMLYLKAHKTNVFVLIKRKALETSYSLSAQNCTDEGKLLINPYNLKAVVNLRFHCVLEDGRLLQAYPAPRDVTLFTYMLQRNTLRKQKASGQAIWEATSSRNCLGLLPTIFFDISTFTIRVFRNDLSLCPRCHQCEKLLLCVSFSPVPKSCMSYDREFVICDSICLFSVFSGCCKEKKWSSSLYSCQIWLLLKAISSLFAVEQMIWP